MDDTNIIDLYWKRNQDAISHTDRRYGGRLFSLANNILHNREDAEESVSDTYLKTWETLPPQRPKHLFAYLAKLCRHFSFGKLDWRNAAKRSADIVSLSQEMELCIPDSRLDGQMESREIAQVLNRFLAQLPQENRLIFLRRYWYCDSVKEIAARYHLSEGSVKTRLHRLRKQLSEALSKEGITV